MTPEILIPAALGLVALTAAVMHWLNRQPAGAVAATIEKGEVAVVHTVWSALDSEDKADDALIAAANSRKAARVQKRADIRAAIA